LQLSALLDAEITSDGPFENLAVAGLSADSRRVEPGFVFAALAGSRTDGGRFVAEALAKGAIAVLAAPGAPVDAPAGVAVLRAAEPRRALALMAARFHGGQPQCVVAITGTNGKTSIAEFTRQIFAACGRPAASLGTIGIVRPSGADYGGLTTPDPVALHAQLADLAGEGITHLALEASSHGLDQHRLDGVRIRAGAFNNLGRDHLDYHPTMAAYLAAKLRLWQLMQPGSPAVVNADGPAAAEAIAAARQRGLEVLTVGAAGETLRLLADERSGFAQSLHVAGYGREWRVTLPLIGAYQAGNALVAAALAIACGEDPDAAVGALDRLTGVKGRLEVVARVAGGIAVVDYAHKPEALEAALAALRPFVAGKLICIVGCGGDRDRGKRPIMGRIAAERADVAIITDDNPRSENPALIRTEMLADAPAACEIGDRAEAIRTGVRLLGAGDVLLVAGKGHETGQIVGNKVLPFSDHEEILRAAEELGA
jgi:UDP-N-acetylmuramoyl-L-alanyl-D-glutamate--2,6-diaminopimelate ligase